jgi:DNA-binding NarL/FixJ family response regulator
VANFDDEARHARFPAADVSYCVRGRGDRPGVILAAGMRSLNDKERSILVLVCAGWSNGRIGERIGCR